MLIFKNLATIFLSMSLLGLFQSCKNEPTVIDGFPVIKAITKEGKIRLASGEIQPIPHYDDPNYLVLYLVRHCEKAKDGGGNPDLSEEGKARSERLGKILDEARLDKVCSTNLKRTMQTAAAVALAAGDPPKENFPIEAQSDWLVDLMQGGGGKKFFYAGHSNTVPNLLNELLGNQRFAEIPETDFSRFFVAVTAGLGKTEVLEFRYP